MRPMHRAALAPAPARPFAAALLLILAMQAPASSARPAGSLAGELARNALLPRAPLLPLDAFDTPGGVREVRLAPDGAHLAYIVDAGGNAQLYAQPLPAGPARRLIGLEDGARIHWSQDGSLLFVEQQGSLSGVAVRDGASARIAVFDADKARRSGHKEGFAGVDPSRPRHAIVREDDIARRRSRLLRVGADGAREVLYDGPGMVDEHLLGADGKLAVIRRLDTDFRQLILRRSGTGWAEVTRCQPFRPCSLISLSPEGRHLLMRTPHLEDREALVEVRLDSGARRTVQQDPQGLADLAGVLLSPHTRQPMLAAWLLPQPHLAGIDAPGRRLVADLARRFPEGGVLPESCAPSSCLLVERGARLRQPRYWLYAARERSVRAVLDMPGPGPAAPPDRQLARKIALRYPASDGALVHGYLSLPPGVPARTLPMVTVVHGGPWSHVHGGYEGMVQLLVNRGYAVFQPNFRGSTGYGQRYMLAPGADYGNGRVQADILDGVRWLLAQGVGDPQRQAIMGASFGGYATLLALSHSPGMFRFGFAAQPPTDMARALRHAAAAPPGPGDAPFRHVLRELGIDTGNAAQLAPIARAAPSMHAARVSVPLLVVAGGRDEKVEVEAVVDYVARLQGLGKQVSLLVDPEEGHNTRKPVVRRATLHLMLQMLHRHLGGPPPPAPDAAVADYLARTLRANGALGR